ncbi:MAG: NAD(P)-dependent glycerol-3-phosphate dehydrogenase [Gammaproteobacteria bacterium]|nr:NAD(P)-dependent glycerol-3-phosphate dehydrogenase [Gammaproteobacteria bacterium]MCY4217668.1 NAD(P)-dependent glycerol-3-phosphate dehydrogenase [Gammaproteobacteria bacterium]MCY4275723.1 NAD(P)-dependent glycerol-3-phosphate dehydrogenase [Gammaproteobacteria bacterium]
MQIIPDHISVIGAGSWGTALACLLCENFEQVDLWGWNPTSIEAIEKHRCNLAYLPQIQLPDHLRITSTLSDVINESLRFVLAVPSHAFRQTLEQLHQAIESSDRNPQESTIIWGTKGFDTTSGKLLSEICEIVFGDIRYGVISGPSFANEVANQMPTALTMACPSLQHAEELAQWFRVNYTRVYYSDDPVGVQLGGAIKNVVAIAAGICDGLGFGANARAALITRGLAEVSRIGTALGGRPETLMGLSGLGDLILTCTDDQSRNRRFGIGIGKGKTIEKAQRDIKQEIEGINTIKILYKIASQKQIEIPITEQVQHILCKDADPKQAVSTLLNRIPRVE